MEISQYIYAGSNIRTYILGQVDMHIYRNYFNFEITVVNLLGLSLIRWHNMSTCLQE